MKTLIVTVVLGVMLGVSNTAFGNEIVMTATSLIGKGEVGGNNKGEFVRMVNRGLEDAWCAGFVSYVLKKSGYQIKYTLRARDYWESYKRVKNPRAGDIICFIRMKHFGHVGIVEKVKNGKVYTIEGNTGNYPSLVKRKVYTLGKIPNLLGFVRINKEV